MNYKALYALLRADGSIVINKNLVRSIGLHESIIFGELLSLQAMWEKESRLQGDGSFYATIESLGKDVGLGDRAQRTAIKNLENLGLIAMEVKGMPAKRYFRVTQDTELILSYIAAGEKGSRSGGPLVAAFEDSSFCERGKHDTAFVALSNTNNNTNNNTNKTTPPSAEEPVENKIEGVTEPTTDELSSSFLEGSVRESPSTTKSKGVFKKIEKKEYGKIISRDVFDYFSHLYKAKYKRYPGTPSPKALGIIKTSFLEKYGGEKGIEIIDLLFKYYERIDLDRSNFPRPEISSLSQDWLINKILDFAYKIGEEKKIEEREEATVEVIKGPYLPVKWDLDQFSRLGLYAKGIITQLGKHGYLKDDWLDWCKADIDEAIRYINEEVIPEWNQNNKYQMRLL